MNHFPLKRAIFLVKNFFMYYNGNLLIQLSGIFKEFFNGQIISNVSMTQNYRNDCHMLPTKIKKVVIMWFQSSERSAYSSACYSAWCRA